MLTDLSEFPSAYLFTFCCCYKLFRRCLGDVKGIPIERQTSRNTRRLYAGKFRHYFEGRKAHSKREKNNRRRDRCLPVSDSLFFLWHNNSPKVARPIDTFFESHPKATCSSLNRGSNGLGVSKKLRSKTLTRL